MKGQTVVVFGGSSGIGEATAQRALREGAHVVIVGRDADKLARARERLGPVEVRVADACSRASVDAALAGLTRIDHVVVCVSGSKGAGAFATLDLRVLEQALKEKTLAQLTVVQAAAARLAPRGSIVLVSAASARSRLRGTAGLAAVNGALEAMVPILALELAPLRVNAVSPGVIDTPWWSGLPAAAKDELFRNAETTLPVGRVGRADEVADVIVLLAQSEFVTGSVYEVDGGAHLVTQ
jgi:NAD(P)-dependent dehydrogenase (short-subunit alcohol dehydrogenase family)